MAEKTGAKENKGLLGVQGSVFSEDSLAHLGVTNNQVLQTFFS